MARLPPFRLRRTPHKDRACRRAGAPAPLTAAAVAPISPSPGTSGLLAFGGGCDRNDAIERGIGRTAAPAALSFVAPRHPRDGPDLGPFRRRHDRHLVGVRAR